ncbi:MAG: MmgE/PrpD family protein, partial [Negativicoccus succinicivorans]|nr:MmgE/PrpD family protein [Negativicoccus succinicivorans]
MDLTKQLAGYAAGLQYKDLAEETVQNAKKCILDWAGVCIRGSQETPIQILRAVLGQNTGADQ